MEGANSSNPLEPVSIEPLDARKPRVPAAVDRRSYGVARNGTIFTAGASGLPEWVTCPSNSQFAAP
jgi:hypothetical protein